MKGIQFVIDDQGEKKAAVIDLDKHKALWEDFYDRAVAESRRNEPRETLESVKKRLSKKARRRSRG